MKRNQSLIVKITHGMKTVSIYRKQEKYNMEVEKLKTEYDRQNKSIFSLDYKLALT